MALEKVKTEAGACTPHSQSSRWMPCGEAKQAAKKRRRRADRLAAEAGRRAVEKYGTALEGLGQ